MESVGGGAVRPIAPRWPDEARGFTLLEMLVALLIMGLAVALVSAIVRPDDRARLRVEGDRLAQLLRLAATQARTTGQTLGWSSDGTGYRFWRVSDGGAWSEIHRDDLLRRRRLPRGMSIAAFEVEGAQAQRGMRLEFPPYGVTPAFRIEMALGRQRVSVAGSPVGDVRVLGGEAASGYEAPAPR